MRTKAMALILGLLLGNAHAVTIRVNVLDSDGKPIGQAAVYATPDTPQPVARAKPKTLVIDQVDKEFVNHLTIVQTGTPVSFPNHDKIRHHVYSFSEAKNFELPLYEGTPAKPVVFDKAGVVTLGCNIHDWMSAYVLVVDSPFFALTDNQGAAQLEVPAGHGYAVSAWHPQVKKRPPGNAKVTVAAGNSTELALTLDLKKSFRPIRLPATANLDAGYR